MSSAPILTDRTALLLHRARAADRPVHFLQDEASTEIEERLAEVKKSFNAPALVGPASPSLVRLLPSAVQVEDAATLALGRGAHDLVIHSFGLHWADDPVGQLIQCRHALEPDGLFIAVLYGGATLSELRACLAEAEAQVAGGLSPRVLPMADLRDLGGLLQRAGFALPVADSRKLTVRYPDFGSLVRDLRGMGETNALAARSRRIPDRRLFAVAEDLYRANFADGGYLTCSFELAFLTGWAPAETQQKPLRPGSASARLSDALGVPETKLKD